MKLRQFGPWGRGGDPPLKLSHRDGSGISQTVGRQHSILVNCLKNYMGVKIKLNREGGAYVSLTHHCWLVTMNPMTR